MIESNSQLKQMYWLDGKWVYVDAENANNLDLLDSTDFASRMTETRLDQSSSHLIFGNNDWSKILYNISADATASAQYNAINQGMSFTGINKQYGISVHVPIATDFTYHVKVTVKKVSGDGNFSLGIQGLDNSFNKIGTPKMSIADNVNVSTITTLTGKIAGYGAGVNQFPLGSNYFDIVFYTGQNSSNASSLFVIQSLEIIKVQNDLYSGSHLVWHEGNFNPTSKADVYYVNSELTKRDNAINTKLDNSHASVIGTTALGHVKNGGNVTIASDGKLNTTPAAIGAYTKAETDAAIDVDINTHAAIIAKTELGHVKNGGNVYVESDGRITTTPTSIGAYSKKETDDLIAIKLTDKTYVDAHIADSVKHITTEERNKWNAKAEASGTTTKDFNAKNLTVAGNIVPTGNSTQTIGTATNRFKAIYVDEAYLSTNTLYIGDTPIMGTEGDTVNIKTDPDQSILMKTSSTGSTTVTSDKAVNITTSGMNGTVTVQATGTNSQANIAATSAVNVNAPKVNISGETVVDGNLTAKNLNITGNFTIGGTLTTVNTDNLVISDNIIDINKGEVGQGVSEGLAGIKIDRGDLSDVLLVFDETDDKFKVGESSNLLPLATEKYVYDNRYIHPAGTNPHGTTKADVGLGNVTNESKATMFTNPNFTGIPTAPTAADNTNTTQLATTAFVMRESAKKANVSHGNHVPTVESANVRRFLRNDNTWQALPTATTTGTGIVQLNDDVTSNSTTQAATINAVKKAYDLAASRATTDLVTTTADGLMRKEDKSKLDGIEANANKYIHPSTHNATMIVEDTTHRFVTDTEKQVWNAKSDRTYVDNTFLTIANPAATGTLRVGTVAIYDDTSMTTGGGRDAVFAQKEGSYWTEARLTDGDDMGLMIRVSKNSGSSWSTILDANETFIQYKGNRIYHEGDKPNKSDVGLSNVDNTSDLNKPVSTATQTALNTKVDKVTGKQLSTEDYTTAEKNKLAGIATNANNYVHPSTHNASMIVEDPTRRFVTDTEKATWNAKETPSGAQAKADAALASAKSYAEVKKAELIDGASTALNTLNKISAAINNDAFYHQTVTNALATKADKTYVDDTFAPIHTHPYAPNTHPNVVASATLGHIKSGGDITVDSSGIVSVNDNSHNHTITNVTGLQAALDAKSNNHSHPYAPDTHPSVVATATTLGHIKSGGHITVSTTGVVSVNDNSHNHTIANVTGLQSALDSKETPTGAQTKATEALTSAKAYTDTKISELVDGSTEALDTLKELADALGNDPNFATTVTTEIGKKADKTYVDSTFSPIHSHPYAPNTHPNVVATTSALGHIKSGGDITVDSTGIVSVNDNSHNHTIANVTGLQTALDSKSNNHSHPYRPDTWVPAWSDVTGKPSTFAPSAHTHASSDVTAMTGYAKASSVSAIATTDSLNVAIGKLEKALDTKSATHSHPYAPDTHPSVIATTTVLGHVKAGSNVTISTAGVLTVNDNGHNHTIANVTGLQSALDAKSDNHTHPYRPDTWVPSWNDVTNKPITFAPSAHNQASNTITAMTGYVMPSTYSSISATDSLNTAIGKLEKAIESKAAGHDHPYLNLAGGTMTGDILFTKTLTGISWSMNTDKANIRFKNDSDGDTDSYLEFNTGDNNNEYFKFSHTPSGSTTATEWMSIKNDGVRVKGNLVYHTGNKPTPADIGAAATSHTHTMTMWTVSKTITVDGDANTYYPVVIDVPVAPTTIEIYRGYAYPAPSTWYTATHKGSLQLRWTTCDGEWGGTKVHRTEFFTQNYSKQVANVETVAHGYKTTVWLRGGGAQYVYRCTENVQPIIYYERALIFDSSTDAYDVYVEPTTVISEPYNTYWTGATDYNVPILDGTKRVYSPNNKPSLSELGAAAASHTHTSANVSGLATVATTGSYNDLTNKPVLINDATTVTSQTWSSSKIQTAIDDRVSGLINSAPGALDTLKELADALGNDPQFATTVTTELGKKANTTYVDAELAKKAGLAVATQTANGLMASADKKKLDGIATGAEVNQNAFSNVKVGTVTVAADTKLDTLELVAGTGITLTADATNDKITISGVNQYTHPTGDGNSHIPANGTTNGGKFLQATSTAGSYQWVNLPSASTSTPGIIQIGTGATNAAAGNHTHSYLPLSGGTLTGALTVPSLKINIGEGLEFLSEENYFGTNQDARIIRSIDVNGSEVDGGLVFEGYGINGSVTTRTEWLVMRQNTFTWKGNKIYHAGDKPTPAEIGAATSSHTHSEYAASSHTHSYLPLSGGTMTDNATPITLVRSSSPNLNICFKNTTSGSVGTKYLGTYQGTSLRFGDSADLSSANLIYHTGYKPTPADIGAAAASHTHSYLPISGGTLTGSLITASDKYFTNGAYGIHMKNSDIIGINCLVFNDESDGVEGLCWPKAGKTGTSTSTADFDVLKSYQSYLYYNTNKVYHEGYKPTAAAIGAAAASHTHSYLPLSGGTLTGNLVMNQAARIQIGSNAASYIQAESASSATIYMQSNANIVIKADADNSTTTEYVHLQSGNGNGLKVYKTKAVVGNDLVIGAQEKAGMRYNETTECIEFYFA